MRHWAKSWTSGTTACGLKVVSQGVDGVWLGGTWGYVDCEACRKAGGPGTKAYEDYKPWIVRL